MIGIVIDSLLLLKVHYWGNRIFISHKFQKETWWSLAFFPTGDFTAKRIGSIKAFCEIIEWRCKILDPRLGACLWPRRASFSRLSVTLTWQSVIVHVTGTYTWQQENMTCHVNLYQCCMHTIYDSNVIQLWTSRSCKWWPWALISYTVIHVYVYFYIMAYDDGFAIQMDIRMVL